MSKEIYPPHVSEGIHPVVAHEFKNLDPDPATLYPSLFKASVPGQNNLCLEQVFPTVHLTEVEFDQQFTLVKNHLVDDSSFNGCLFETYGVELDYVLTQPVQHIWTYRENDIGKVCLVNGISVANKIGYLITEQPWDLDKCYLVELENE